MLESRDPVKASLLSFESINFQCEFVEQYLKPHIRSILVDQNSPYEIKFEYLSSLIAKFANAQSCNDLEAEDVGKFILTFKYCAPIYQSMADQNLMVFPTVEQAISLQLSSICVDKHLIDAYNYLVEKNYYFRDAVKEKNFTLVQRIMLAKNLDLVEPPVVKHASIYISVKKRDSKFLLPFYRFYLEPNFLSKSALTINENKNFRIVGLNFDIKYDLFTIYIWSSLVYILIAMGIALLVVLVYLKSVLLTLACLSCALISLLDAYFVFVLVFKFEFFSFMNIMGVFIVVGVSCTNMFLLCDTWCEAKLKYKNILVNKTNIKGDMRRTSKFMPSREDAEEKHESVGVYHQNAMLSLFMEHCARYLARNAILPIFVTNLTLAVGFLICLSSSIIAIRLFGIYAALVILINLLLEVSLVPGLLIMLIKYASDLRGLVQDMQIKCAILNKICKLEVECIKLKNLIQILRQYYQRFFEEHLPDFIVSFRYVFVTLLFLLGVGGFVLIFAKPGLKLPNSTSSFQFFDSANPLEYYEQHISALSDSDGIYVYQQEKKPYLNVNYIFGVASKDTSDHLRVDDLGYIAYDEAFDFYEEKSQLWYE